MASGAATRGKNGGASINATTYISIIYFYSYLLTWSVMLHCKIRKHSPPLPSPAPVHTPYSLLMISGGQDWRPVPMYSLVHT